MTPSIKKLDYLPGLDGIRALAALLVISTHWPNYDLSLKFGWIGVNIFFVLSGFLITRILVNERPGNFKLYVRNFFYKRALRIFPAYYLFLIATSLMILMMHYFVPQLSGDDTLKAGLLTLKDDWIAYLTYTINLKMNLAYILNWPGNSHVFFGHVWSLAVEEQFYIIFPFIVYFSSPALLKKLVIAVIIICPLLRLWVALVGVNLVTNKYWIGELVYTNTFFQADALAVGALMVLFPLKIKFPYLNFFIVSLICVVVGLTCFFFLRKAGYFLVSAKSIGFDFPPFWFDQKTPWFIINIRAVYQYMLVNLFAFALILPATLNKPLFPAIFQSRPAVYFGKISYGIYLYHIPLLGLFTMITSLYGGWNIVTKNIFIYATIVISYLAILFLLAHLSYKYFERKIIDQFKYKFDNNER